MSPIYGCTFDVLAEEIVEQFYYFRFYNVPVVTVETRAETIRSGSCVSVHLMESIKDFLVGEGVINVPELRDRGWIEGM